MIHQVLPIVATNQDYAVFIACQDFVIRASRQVFLNGNMYMFLSAQGAGYIDSNIVLTTGLRGKLIIYISE
jgi:hypothetical protein